MRLMIYNLTINHTTVIDILLPIYLLQFLHFPGAIKKLGCTEDKVIKKISDMCRMAAHQKGGSKFNAANNHACMYTNRIMLVCIKHGEKGLKC